MTTELSGLETQEQAAVAAAAAELANAAPEDILRWAIDRYGDGLTLACSFGDTSGIVLLDMLQRLAPGAEVFYLDTDFLFDETLRLVETSKARWPQATIVAVHPSLSPDEQAHIHGAALWEQHPNECCDLRKVQPLTQHLAGKRAWITGLRRDQATTRTETPVVQWDAKFGLVKLNPLASWDEQRTWAYIFANDLPYNPLHDQNYPTLGCTNCTLAVVPGADPRSGRWAGSDKIECGLHGE